MDDSSFGDVASVASSSLHSESSQNFHRDGFGREATSSRPVVFTVNGDIRDAPKMVLRKHFSDPTFSAAHCSSAVSFLPQILIHFGVLKFKQFTGLWIQDT